MVPPVVASLPAEAAAGMMKGYGGVLDNDATMEGICFTIKAPL